MSAEEITKSASEMIKEQRAKIDALESAQRARPGISVPGVEEKKFSFARLLNAMSKGAHKNQSVWDAVGAGYEREVVMAATQKALSLGTTTAGGFWVPEEAMPAVDMLRSNLVIAKAGMRRYDGLSGSPVVIPRLSASAVGAWGAENTAVSASDQTLAEVSLTPHRATAATRMSNQLIETNSAVAEALVRNDLMQVVERLIEKGALEGSGSSNQPTGIATASGIGSVAVDDTGTPTAAEQMTGIIATMKAVEVGNGNMDNTYWIMHPTDYYSLFGAQVLPYSAAPTPSGFLGGAINGGLPTTLAGRPILRTTNMTASGDSSGQILFGDFSESVVGAWGGLFVKTESGGETLSLADQSLVIVRKFVDVGVFNPLAFAKLTDFSA